MNSKKEKHGLRVLNGGKKEAEVSFQKIIGDHFPLIERLCFNAVKRQLKNLGPLNNPVNIENEALELSNQVLDTLERDDYRVLRQFKGNARLSTYITTIIARQAVDMLRKKLGRSREKERAQKFGKIGLLIYEKIILQGCSIPEIYPALTSEADAAGFPGSLEEVEHMLDKIKGKKGGLHFSLENNPVVRNGAIVDEAGEYIIPDTGSDPRELLIKEQREQKISLAIKNILAQLNGEERLILRMRFPAREEEKPGKVEAISMILGISEKAVYKRIARVLKKCRELLDRQGVTVNDLL